MKQDPKDTAAIKAILGKEEWLKPYFRHLAAIPSKLDESDKDLNPFIQQIGSIRICDWKDRDLSKPGDSSFREMGFPHEGSLLTIELQLISRVVVFWHWPSEKPFRRHSDWGLKMSIAERHAASPKFIIDTLTSKKSEDHEPEDVHIDGVVQLDYLSVPGGHPPLKYNFKIYKAPPDWFPTW
jgi:hypothetical protein